MINPNGGAPGYYPPTPYPQQPGPYPPGAPYGAPGMAPDLYAGYQAPPPGGGLQGGVASIGTSLNGIFGVLGNILNTVVNLVTSVIKGVFNLLGAIFKPILGLFGLGKNDQQKQQQPPPQAGNAMPQMPLYNPQIEQALQAAEASIVKHESYVIRALSHRQTASVDEHVRMMNQALADFKRHYEELSRVARPDQLAAFNARAQEVLAMYQQLAGSPSTAQASPGDLSGLQLPNDPALQQNLAQFNQNYQLLSQAPGRAAQLTAEERHVVSQSISELRAQAAQFEQASPQVAAVLNEAVDRLDQQWQQAIAASPPASQSQNPQANTSAGRQYRAVPLDLDLATPPAPAAPVPTHRGA